MSAQDTASRDERAKEWDGIMEHHGGNRPVMTMPPREIPTSKFVDDVRHEIPDLPPKYAHMVADWAIDKMERYAAAFAIPMFDMQGNGPICSFCKALWPLCGHHHLSTDLPVDDEEGESDE